MSSISIHVPAWGTTYSVSKYILINSISIHVPAWGTTHNCTMYLYTDIFQSTFPRGERLRLPVVTLVFPLFQSTFPRGERRRTAAHLTTRRNFNPRSRVGNDRTKNIIHIFLIYFNPRSRVGNDGETSRITFDNLISIHVPAWGTTADSCTSYYKKKFQSTFPRGERPYPSYSVYTSQYFNPRSRVGNDKIEVQEGLITAISIHVPAWGTTQTYQHTDQRENFNPRSRVGNDLEAPGH